MFPQSATPRVGEVRYTILIVSFLKAAQMANRYQTISSVPLVVWNGTAVTQHCPLIGGQKKHVRQAQAIEVH